VNPFFGGQFFSGGFFGSLVGGTSKRDKKLKRVIRRSALSQDDYEEQLKALVREVEVRPFTEPEVIAEIVEDDDEILLKVLALTVH
jgi:hypothetical protein